MKNTRFYLCLLVLAVTAACSHSTPAPKREYVAGDWQVMVSHEGKGDMLCYAGASPLRSEGTLTRRAGKAYMMVTRRKSGKIEISASAGYPYMGGSKVELAVDDDTYDLFYKGATAWARNDGDDAAIIEAMKSADNIELRGASQEGLTSIDHYPPHGFAQAIQRIRELCP
jgi:hypothetical protein